MDTQDIMKKGIADTKESLDETKDSDNKDTGMQIIMTHLSNV